MENSSNDFIDLETLSKEAREVITNLTLMGFSPKEIKKYSNKPAEYSKIAKEVYTFMCDNWETIQKIGV